MATARRVFTTGSLLLIVLWVTDRPRIEPPTPAGGPAATRTPVPAPLAPPTTGPAADIGSRYRACDRYQESPLEVVQHATGNDSPSPELDTGARTPQTVSSPAPPPLAIPASIEHGPAWYTRNLPLGRG